MGHGPWMAMGHASPILRMKPNGKPLEPVCRCAFLFQNSAAWSPSKCCPEKGGFSTSRVDPPLPHVSSMVGLHILGIPEAIN